MPGHSRKEIVREGEIGVYHTWSRCVQRAYLCGFDPVTGQNFDYRRGWIKSLLEYQASVFALDIGNYSILWNHQHLIARTRPDIAAMWTDEEVAWRWKLAWPQYRDGQWVREPTDQEIEEILARPAKIPKLRANLASLSWLMARWKEPISRMANCESQTKGHYYEQRFGSREFLDDPANLCGNAYLDLNQRKAGLAHSLEASNYSAYQDRLMAFRQREIQESLNAFRSSVPEGYELESSQVEQLLSDCFLAPISDKGPGIITPELKIVFEPDVLIYYSGPPTVRSEPACIIIPDSTSVADENDEANEGDGIHPSTEVTPSVAVSISDRSPTPRGKSRPEVTRRIHRRFQKRRRRRASDVPILGIPLKEYLELIQATADRMDADPSPPMAEPAVPFPLDASHPTPTSWELLRNIGIDPERWCVLIERFERAFFWAVGTPQHMAERAEQGNKKWLHGSKPCREGFT